MSDWYRDRRDGIWTIDLDPDYDGAIEIDWRNFFSPPVSGMQVQSIAAEGDGPPPTVTVATFDSDHGRFHIVGSGALVTFAVRHASANRDDLTLRFRSRQS